MKFTVDLNVFIRADASDHVMDQLNRLLDSIDKMEIKLANELSDLATQVSETNTVIGSAVALIKGLKSALDAAGSDPLALKALRDSLDASEQSLAAAVAANTPGV